MKDNNDFYRYNIKDESKQKKDESIFSIFYKILFLLILAGAMSFIAYQINPKEKEINLSEKDVEDKKVEKTYVSVPSLEERDFKANSVFVYDSVSGKIIFEKNGDIQLPLASITKIMLAFVASDFISKNEIVAITKKDIEKEGDSGLLVDEEWFFEDLLEYTLTSSSNDGASAIAGAAEAVLKSNYEQNEILEKKENGGLVDRSYFVKKMNEKATELGLTQTFFLNTTGLDTNGHISGGYGSAKDVAYLFENIIEEKPWVLEITTKNKVNSSSTDKIHSANNTNIILDEIPCIIGSKTGFTDLAGGNLAVAFDAGIGRPIIAVVLGSTYLGRFDDMRKIVDSVLKSGELHKNN